MRVHAHWPGFLAAWHYLHRASGEEVPRVVRAGDQARVVAFSAAEAAPDGHSAYLEAVESLLASALPSDLIVYNVTNNGTGVTALQGRVQEWSWLIPLIAAVAEEHPLIQAFTRPADLGTVVRPQRVSDIVEHRSFRSSRVYSELYRPMGAAYQLGIPTAAAATNVQGWALNRSSADFTDDDRNLAERLQPALTALEAAFHPVQPVPNGNPAVEVRPPPLARPLTPREREVLDLLAVGYTADHIGRRLRISTSTARRHLEHIYEKLQTHDRLLTVRQAEAMGLLSRPGGAKGGQLD